VQFTQAGLQAETARVREMLGEPPAYTELGRRLASVQIEISGGVRPFAMEGLESRFLSNISGGALAGDDQLGEDGCVGGGLGFHYAEHVFLRSGVSGVSFSFAYIL